MVWTRLHDSFAYRSSRLYRGAAKLLPLSRIAQKPGLGLTYVTFGGAGHAAMLIESVISLGRTWPRLPRVRIVSDGTLNLERTRKALSRWPGPLEVVDWRDLLPAVPANHLQKLQTFARREPMGRKLVAIVASAIAAPTLYCDCDFLWFRHPPTLDHLLRQAPPLICMSADPRPAYDPGLVPDRLPELARPPHSCAGLLFAYGDFISAGDGTALMIYLAERGFGLSEQTFLAEMNRRLGDARWPEDEIALNEVGRTSLRPSFNDQPWSARHYVGSVRHLFWRDAIALRFRPATPPCAS